MQNREELKKSTTERNKLVTSHGNPRSHADAPIIRGIEDVSLASTIAPEDDEPFREFLELGVRIQNLVDGVQEKFLWTDTPSRSIRKSQN